MSRTFKTEAVVLRTIRYGEADRIVRLLTPDQGRISALAPKQQKAVDAWLQMAARGVLEE